MQKICKALILSSSVAAAGLAQGQSTNITLTAGGPSDGAFGLELRLPPDSASFDFSRSFIGALFVAGVETSFIGPASGTVTSSAIGLTAPIARLSGTVSVTDPEVGWPTFTGISLGTAGGFVMTTTGSNFATTGGRLSVSNMGIDLPSKGIYADLAGANGMATQRVRVWDYANLEGSGFSLSYYQEIPNFSFPEYLPYADFKLTGLTINKQAFDLFAQGLGLQPGGIAALGSVKDYGVITTAIPEPSTYLMMGLGLAGMTLAACRRRGLTA